MVRILLVSPAEIPDPKGTAHGHGHHHAHTTKYNANANDLYKMHKHHRPPKVTYQPISDDDDLSGSADEYEDTDTQNGFEKATQVSADIGYSDNSNNHAHQHHHQYNTNHNINNHNANNARHNNIPLFGNGGSGSQSAAGSGTNGNAIVTRSEIRGNNGADNEVSTASANIIVAFFKSHNNDNGIYDNKYNFVAINLLISAMVRLLTT